MSDRGYETITLSLRRISIIFAPQNCSKMAPDYVDFAAQVNQIPESLRDGLSADLAGRTRSAGTQG